jgi:hypothetical protein
MNRRSNQKWAPTYLVTFQGYHLVYGTDSHPTPEPGNLQQTVEGGGQLTVSMLEKLLQIPPTMIRKSDLPPLLEEDVALSSILSDLAVDLAIARFGLVRVFL